MVGKPASVRGASALSVGALALRHIGRLGWRPADVLPLLHRGWRVLRTDGVAALARRLRAAVSRADQQRGYQEWIARYDTLTPEKRTAIESRIAVLPAPPRISVVVPVYAKHGRWLRRAVDSVRGQLYPHWELCLADDASLGGEVRALLTEYAAHDSRIHVTFRERNGHISAASNSALGLASGEYVALLDHDDELPPHALYAVAEEVLAHPETSILYSDEDKIDAEGRRHDPYFKCDFNPDLFLSQNMVSHLGVYRRDLVLAVGGFREGLEGSQDYDLALRVLDHPGFGGIRHIPHVLYHWRAIAGSTARSPDEKSYAAIAARRAVADHLARRGIVAEVESAPGLPAYNRVRYPLPAEPPLVSIVVPTRDRADLLRRCLDGVLGRTEYPRLEVVVVDNGSREVDTLAYLRDLARVPTVTVVRDERPFNFSALVNLGARNARGSVLVLLNDDIDVISPHWLRELVSHALRPEVGPVGAMLYYPDDTVQHAGVLLGVNGVANHAHRHLPRGAPGYIGRAALTQAFSAVTAACMAVRSEVYEAVGGFDQGLGVAYNDVDFCLRTRERGWRTVWTPYAELYHHESATRGSDQSGHAAERLLREADLVRQRWLALVDYDPSYSPNLTLELEDFSLAFPPRAKALWGA